MPILTSPSSAFPTALIYITAGTLIDVWCGVAMVFYPPETNWGKFWLVGMAVTGFALLVIGLFLGQIGRAARNAELPPSEVTPDVAQAEQRAADTPAVVAPGVGAAPGMAAAPGVPAQPGMPIQTMAPPNAPPVQAVPPVPPANSRVVPY